MIDPTAYVHPSAVLIGDVIVEPRRHVGPGTATCSDFGRLILEEGAHLQDTCLMHGFPESDKVVERDGHIRHGAVLHGCRVGPNALVGMNAVFMDDVMLGTDCILAAMTFIKAGSIIPPRILVVGLPARIVCELRDEEIAWKKTGTKQYQNLMIRSLLTMQEVDALTEVEPGRKRISDRAGSPMHKKKAHGNTAAK